MALNIRLFKGHYVVYVLPELMLRTPHFAHNIFTFHTILTINSNCITTQHSLVFLMKAHCALCEMQSEHLHIM